MAYYRQEAPEPEYQQSWDDKSWNGNLWANEPFDKSMFAVTYACKQMRSETLAVFYGDNTFYIHGGVGPFDGGFSHAQAKAYRAKIRACKNWLKQIGSESAATIKKLIILNGRWLAEVPNVRQNNGFKINNKWWTTTRKIESELAECRMDLSAIRARIIIQLMNRFESNRLRSRGRWSSDLEVEFLSLMELAIELPTDSRESAWQEVQSAFKAREHMSKPSEQARDVIIPWTLSIFDERRKMALRAVTWALRVEQTPKQEDDLLSDADVLEGLRLS